MSDPRDDQTDPRAFALRAPRPAAARPRVTIEAVTSEDGYDVIGYVALTAGRRQIARGATKRDAALAAERQGFDPWPSDEEMDAENEALDHGNWPY